MWEQRINQETESVSTILPECLSESSEAIGVVSKK